MALTPAERHARHKVKRQEQILEMIRTGKPLPPKKKFTEAQLARRRKQSAKRMKAKKKMIEEKIRKGEPVHIPMTPAERQAQYRARKKQKELEAMMQSKPSSRAVKKKSNDPKTKHQSVLNSENSFKFPMFAPVETFVIKPEPLDDMLFLQELIYCRCCFKMLSTTEVQHPVNSEALQMFQGITQLTLEPSQLAPSFCADCFNDIISFSQFQKLTTLKQQKFIETMGSNISDLNFIQNIQLDMDPFNAGIKIKDEELDGQTVKQEFISVEINSFESSYDGSETLKEAKRLPKKCRNCDEIPRNMKLHLARCRPLKCNKCEFIAFKRSLLDRHVIEMHYKGSPQPRICQFCEKPYINLERHIVAVHEKAENYVCDLCGYISLSRTYVEFHMKSWHLEKKFKCTKCDYKTFTQERLGKHLLTVHKEVKVKKVASPEDLKCPECDKNFKSIKNVESHVLRVHRKLRDFNCDKCHRSFFDGWDLKIHQDNIHNKKDIICEICGKSFPFTRFLRSHMVRHQEPQYSCEICGTTFFFKSVMKRHIDNSHLNLFSHVCKICNKGFRDAQKLKYHSLKHAGIKFSCFVTGCASTTSRPDALKFHMKHNHSLSPEEQSEYLAKLKEYNIEVMKKKL